MNEDTAEGLSKMFGKEFRQQQSLTINDDSDSNTISFQLQEILPAADIGQVTQGTFFGRVADNFDTPIERKLFCGIVDVDEERNAKKRKVKQGVPIMTDFFHGQIPALPEPDKERLSKLNPKLKDKPDKLLELYIDEQVQDEIDANFERIKKEVEALVDYMYGITKPYADRDRAKRKQEEEENE